MNGDGKQKTASYVVRTKNELDKLLNDQEFAKTAHIQLVEVIMEQLDAPRALVGQTQAKSKN